MKILKLKLSGAYYKRLLNFINSHQQFFFGNLNVFPKTKTREDLFKKKAELFDRIKEIVKEDDEE